MSLTPNPNNYVLGRGVVYFNRRNPDGTRDGERDLGNAPAFAINLDLEQLEHFSSRRGLRAKDKEVTLQITPAVNFTLDEVNVENIRLIYLADSDTIVQGEAFSTGTFDLKLNRWFSLDNGAPPFEGFRKIGLQAAFHGTVTTGPFVVGETITGTTSGATAVVVRVDSSSLVVDTIGGTPPFVDLETITGGTSTATAPLALAASLLVSGNTAIVSSGLTHVSTDTVLLDSGTPLVLGTDYTVDSVTGRVKILPGSAVAVDTTITWNEFHLAVTYVRIKTFADTNLEGFLRFVSDNATGPNQELRVWRVNLQPDGDIAYIGDDFSTLTFTGEILVDELCHPDNPFMEIIMDEDALDASAGVCD
jgi:hypothetical protein